MPISLPLFNKQPQKSPEELQREREAKISSTSDSLKLQIRNLEKKRDILLKKVAEARQKNLKEQEAQAVRLLKQTLAAIKREYGMLMTLELAIESRDLAQLNTSFLESIGTLSDDILSTNTTNNESKMKKISDKFLRAIYESNQQKERIDDMLAMGDFASAVNTDSEQYAEFDEEIESLLQDAESYPASSIGTIDRNKF